MSKFNGESGVQIFVKKYLASVFRNFVIVFAYPVPSEGRFAIVTSVGTGCDGRGGARGERAKADGQVVWSWRPWAGAKCARR
jgi:hypothetical protein